MLAATLKAKHSDNHRRDHRPIFSNVSYLSSYDMLSVSHGGTSDGYLYSSPIKEPFPTTRPGEERKEEDGGGARRGWEGYKRSQKKNDVLFSPRTVRLVGTEANMLRGVKLVLVMLFQRRREKSLECQKGKG